MSTRKLEIISLEMKRMTRTNTKLQESQACSVSRMGRMRRQKSAMKEHHAEAIQPGVLRKKTGWGDVRDLTPPKCANKCFRKKHRC